jgi:hypothetical protein
VRLVQINARQFVGPRILASGRPVETTGGHIYSEWGVDTVGEIREAVRSLAGRGVDFIKLIVSAGTTTPGTHITDSQYTLQDIDEALTRIIHEASALVNNAPAGAARGCAAGFDRPPRRPAQG